MDGPLTVPRITQQVRAEGAGEVVVVTDDPERYSRDSGFASGIKVYDRKELDQVQRRLREIPGVTVLVYEQTCAAEKRRRVNVDVFRILQGGFLSTRMSAKVAGIVESNPTAWPSCLWRRNSVENGWWINQHVTKITPVPTGSAQVLSA